MQEKFEGNSWNFIFNFIKEIIERYLNNYKIASKFDINIIIQFEIKKNMFNLFFV